MPISSEQDLERAVEEFQRLSDAPDESKEGERRRVLDADIKAYYAQCSDALRPGKPRHE
ncbi:hypothetical protein [Azospirillum agricola]|uniref:hypothetical protein n=1 Tax=Azospirillum agricola TaxID=1720247 RepID=UPI000A0F3777|nr:hypothetical protein [Azospirillum agricola]MBP2227516.1 antitoxin component HigA of HigAB toxin-antitoxin module [Azospirillum agricola]SMH59534.1 hypothetical protein SAMN02982994_5102 [Azospirillum lipoferum]